MTPVIIAEGILLSIGALIAFGLAVLLIILVVGLIQWALPKYPDPRIKYPPGRRPVPAEVGITGFPIKFGIQRMDLIVVGITVVAFSVAILKSFGVLA